MVGDFPSLGYLKSFSFLKGELDELPRKPVLIEIRHKGIWIVLLDVPNARFVPAAREHLLGADHCWDTGGVGDGL